MEVTEALHDLARIGQGAWSGRLQRTAFVASGLARAIAIATHNAALANLMFPGPRIEPTPDEDRELRRRIIALFETDWRNVEEGLYPASLARGFSWTRLARVYPRLLLDAPNVRRRMRDNVFDELPPEAQTYPRYYQRNFHFQSEGYLGKHSAAVYDTQVELLFGGTADAMRRQVLPPIVRHLRGRERAGLKVLDLACGTGPVLGMLAAALPGVPLWGLDLSPHYIAQARRALKDLMPLSLVVENAERLPFIDESFEAITNVYLLHELPTDVRARVLVEAARVLKPGGILVVADSAQPSDSPQLRRQIEHFPKQFHEPYYLSYLRDDLPARLKAAGLVVDEMQTHMVTKVIVAHKPARRGQA